MEEQEEYREASYVDINLDYSEGEWFEYFTSHIDQKTGDVVYGESTPNARVKIRSTAPFLEERLKKQKRTEKIVHNPKTRSMERVPYFQEPTTEEMMRETDDMYDYAVMDLEGFRNKKTAETIECTRENKIALRHNQVFRRFFERCQQILHGDSEEAAKN